MSPLVGLPANRKVGVKENRHTKRRALPPRNRWFESGSLQRRVQCEPNFRERIPSMTLGFRQTAPPNARFDGIGPDRPSQVRNRLAAGGSWIRTVGLAETK